MSRAQHLTFALQGRWHGGPNGYGLARCPAHDDRSPSLSIKQSHNGRVLVHCHAGCSQDQVIGTLIDMGLWEGSATWEQLTATSIRSRPTPPPADDHERRIETAAAIWRGARPIAGTIAERYLREAREIEWSEPWPACLRFHTRCPRGSGHAPAMIALMSDAISGEARAVHRTYLEPDGSGRDGDRMMLGVATGCVVKLSPDEDVTTGIAIAEGIETALSGMMLGARPMWACASAGGIERFPVLAGIETIVICSDHDGAGLTAARQCAERWRAAGRETRIRRSYLAGLDMNDLLRRAPA